MTFLTFTLCVTWNSRKIKNPGEEQLSSFLKRNVDINGTCPNVWSEYFGFTAVWCAIYQNRWKLLKFLIKKGAEFNEKSQLPRGNPDYFVRPVIRASIYAFCPSYPDLTHLVENMICEAGAHFDLREYVIDCHKMKRPINTKLIEMVRIWQQSVEEKRMEAVELLRRISDEVIFAKPRVHEKAVCTVETHGEPVYTALAQGPVSTSGGVFDDVAKLILTYLLPMHWPTRQKGLMVGIAKTLRKLGSLETWSCVTSFGKQCMCRCECLGVDYPFLNLNCYRIETIWD